MTAQRLSHKRCEMRYAGSHNQSTVSEVVVVSCHKIFHKMSVKSDVAFLCEVIVQCSAVMVTERLLRLAATASACHIGFVISGLLKIS